MKALLLNGSPRKNFNTAQMLQKAMDGASEAGAETELVNLFDYEFTGCRSCFACKIKNSAKSAMRLSSRSICRTHTRLEKGLWKKQRRLPIENICPERQPTEIHRRRSVPVP